MELYPIFINQCDKNIEFFFSFKLKNSNILFRYQVFWLFFGMSLCLPIKRCLDTLIGSNLKMEGDSLIAKKKYSPFLIIFPSCCDVFATILDSTGLIYVIMIFFKCFFFIFQFFSLKFFLFYRLMFQFIKC